MRRAHSDGIFGDIEFLPVKWDGKKNPDITIANYAELVYNDDKKSGYSHCLMVRTDSKKRANELMQIYNDNTSLNLQVIHSGYSYRHVKKAIESLRKKKLDGIICVSMLGEGFDFPQLKIAAIHTPHKSLEVTLQFIGRFARTSGENLGNAKFLAIPNQIRLEAERLYTEDSTWQEIIANLSETKIEMEAKVRQHIDTFKSAEIIDFELKDLSLYALRPYSHVKIYETDGDVDFESDIMLPPNFEIVYRRYSPELSTSILLTRETLQPRWSSLEIFQRIEYDLFIVYFHREANLVFVNSSRRSTALYEMIAKKFCTGPHRILELFRINRILKNLEQIDCFNIGMRNRVRSTKTESYRIIAGSHAQEAVRKTDGRLFHRGHIFAKANSLGDSITIGYSSGSKVWRNQNLQIPLLVEWCKDLGDKINSEGIVSTGSNLDILETSSQITSIPEGIIAVDWHENAFSCPWRIHHRNNSKISCDLFDCELKIIDVYSNDTINLLLAGPSFEWPFVFSLNSESYYSKSQHSVGSISISNYEEDVDIIDYFNNYPLRFFVWNFSWFSGREFFPAPDEFEIYARERIVKIDWDANQVDITNEFKQTSGNQISIHEYLKNLLLESEADVVFYDHGAGEIADLLAITSKDTHVEVVFYHCKSSSERFPGNRVSDIYEVTGQVIKSTNINKYTKLHEHLKKRTKSSSYFIKGNLRDMEKCFEMTPLKPMKTKIALVQPGISSSKISEKNLSVIAAADDFVSGAGSMEMIVFGSK